MGHSRALFAVAFASAAVTFSCLGKDPYNPGTSLGTFSVTSALVSTSCGAAPNPWDFDVKLSTDHDTLYWVQGGVPVSGVMDALSHVSMTASAESTVVAADPKTNLGGCTLTRTDNLSLTMTGAPISAFTGTLAYSFTPTQDSDCTQAIGPSGYATLPCTVTYGVTGKQTAGPPANGN